ncbi:hypothetical protein CP880_01035 [Cutibacterium namnetense]|uniref:Uncharacterized protein n=1 Tax=Cutibacterium namnetense TaxID=1574624 RepID=A0ABX9IAT5_9ACTN|nr:hypothetical protein CP880_01035 [Cutibacterium namnetense]TKW71857.1 MAG: hypothetical protein DI580_06615 [Cutibacterium acnes]
MRRGSRGHCPGSLCRWHRFAATGQPPRELARFKIIVLLCRSPMLVIGGHACTRWLPAPVLLLVLLG